MRTRWKSLTTSGRFILTVHLSVAVFCLAATIIDAITVVMLNIVVVFWAAFTITVTIAQHRRLKKISERIARTTEVFKPGGTQVMSDLSPEDQEEIQISWARHKLSQ